jgi:arylsulfatase A-like enzyme
MCDQLRYDAVGAHGNPYVDTPNLDRLAARSVRFTHAYCNSPLCGPTRHSLATGRYPYRHGVINNVLRPKEGMYTIAHHLGEHGYRRACFGHMHWQRIETGDGRPNVFPDHGYETYEAINHDVSMLGKRAQSRYLWERMGLTNRCTAGASIVPEAHCYSRQIADASIAQLREWAAMGEPFLSWTSFNDPHPPFFPPAAYWAKYSAMDLPAPRMRPDGAAPSQAEVNPDPVWSQMTPLDHRAMKAGYYGLIELADYHLGRVLDALDELDLWDDTMILFGVDHGEMMGDFGRYSKGVMWEQAVHLPFYVYHPDLAPGDRAAFAEHVDVLPTVCDYLGLPIPDGVQGRSLRPVLENTETPDDWREYALAQLNDDVMIRTTEWKLVYEDGTPTYLFDWVNDPEEYYNVIDERPDVVAELTGLFQRDHGDLFAANDRIRAAGRFRKKKRKPTVALAETR